MKKLILGFIFVALVVCGCAGSREGFDEYEEDPLDSALVGFTSSVQGSRWQEALSYITESEANEISPDGYEFKEEYRTAASRLPLSTLRKSGLQVDNKGRLIGIKDVMDASNQRYKVSAEQAKVGTNLRQMEDERIRRRIEEGQKIMQEEKEQANQEQKVEVYSNKLTDEEKRKYGSTRDLKAPETYEDADTEEAKEELHGDYED